MTPEPPPTAEEPPADGAAPAPLRAVLVANRGEIARRVFRTCRELGLATVAVHSDADARAAHVREADTAVRLAGDAPADTYLRGDLVVAAALAAGADAVHPGYGFLSENAGFARAVLDAGLRWIGPPPEAIDAMASKTRAKRLMAAAGVPLLQPLDHRDVTEADLPLLVKAAAGGGGRGMRVVRRLADLAPETAAARAEAAAAFGDDEVFLEPYVEDGRHVEVQVLADAHGTVWTLGTRDCSLQRRHQKVVEESPAPGLPDTTRDILYRAAADAARAIGYRGAGTMEFLLGRDGRVHFLEANTRLQVEHPVTEAVHGVDLVALQICVAEGHRLPPLPPAADGHAVEARLYAEDPADGFRPRTGTLHHLHVDTGPGLRLDSGFGDGDTVSVHYDPLLAKVVAWAPTREEAVRRLAHALERARVHGPATNRDLLVRSLRHPGFTDPARLGTAFYDRHLAALTEPAPGEAAEAGLAALAAAVAAAHGRSRFGGFRNVPSAPQVRAYLREGAGQDGARHEVRYRLTRDGLRTEGLSGPRPVLLECDGRRVVLEVAGVRRTYHVARYEEDAGPRPRTAVHVDVAPLTPPPGVTAAPGGYAFTELPRFTDPSARPEAGSLLAPMPGTVARLADGLAEGATVTAGQPLLWLEAMKMEHRVTAPADGTLTALHVVPGQRVERGAPLAVVGD